MEKKIKQKFVGKIIKLSSQKTVKVEVESKYRHPIYSKILKKHRNFLAHNEDMELNVGDTVLIEYSKPFSKLKSWIVKEKLK